MRYFGAVVTGAISGDGYVSAAMKEVGLTSGEREIALLWAALFAAHGIKTKVRRTRTSFEVTAYGDDAARLARLYFLYGSPLLEGGDDMLKSHKLAEAVRLGAGGLNISWEGLRRTPSGLVAADLTISEASIAVKYTVYLRNDKILLEFVSSNLGRVELAARLLRLAGVDTEVKKVGGRDVWRVIATTDKLAAGRKELRDALAEVVRRAVESGWVEAGKAESWLEKLERGRALMEGWPKYLVRLSSSGALEVRFASTSPDSIEREAQRLREMGLEEGRHFTVKMPEEGRDGYVRILREGLERAAWLSVHGKGEQQRLAAEFVSYILQRAEEEGENVRKKAEEIVEEGKAWGSLRLEGFEKKVEVYGNEHMVKVIDGSAELKESRRGKKLLRIRITAEVDRVRGEYVITFSRRGRNNAAVGYAVARANAPGGREKDAERLSALIKAITGKEPRIRRIKNGAIIIVCYERHLEGLKHYVELAEVIERWLKETSGR